MSSAGAIHIDSCCPPDTSGVDFGSETAAVAVVRVGRSAVLVSEVSAAEKGRLASGNRPRRR